MAEMFCVRKRFQRLFPFPIFPTMASNDEMTPLQAALKAKVQFFTDIESRDTCMIYTIAEGVSKELIVAYLEAAWGDDKDVRWRFYGDRLVHLYRAWKAEEDKTDDEDSDNSDDDN